MSTPSKPPTASILSRVIKRLRLASALTIKWFQSPIKFFQLPGTKKRPTHTLIRNEPKSYLTAILQFLAIRMPSEHYSLQRQLHHLLTTTWIGNVWEGLMVLLSILACIEYVFESYYHPFELLQFFHGFEIAITQFFSIDFLLNLLASPKWSAHVFKVWSIIDILTILPIYISIATLGTGINFSVLRFVRILRLVRVLRTFRLLNNVSGITRQVIKIGLVLASMLFLGAGAVQILENDIRAFLFFRCRYINALTLWEPSCSRDQPASLLASCDCREFNCKPQYVLGDQWGQPSTINCLVYSFLDSFFVCVYTVPLIGYGGISLSPPTQLGVMIFILFALIYIPMQLNELTNMLSARSIYRDAYVPSQTENVTHVILGGYVSDWRRVERVLKELLHPNRAIDVTATINVVILSPVEPSEGMKALLISPKFDTSVKYVIGSALDVADLAKARADIAGGMLFLCNIEGFDKDEDMSNSAHETPREKEKVAEAKSSFAGSGVARNKSFPKRSSFAAVLTPQLGQHQSEKKENLVESTTMLLQTLAINSFNPDLNCLVQVFNSEDRELLKDSSASCVFCLDEYRTMLQARNCICPGLSTLVDNLFHMFGEAQVVVDAAAARSHSPDPFAVQAPVDMSASFRYQRLKHFKELYGSTSSEEFSPWFAEYSRGTSMSPYFIPLAHSYLAALSFEWPLISEGIFLEFDLILIGVASPSDNSVLINPCSVETSKLFKYNSKLFAKYSIGIILAPTQIAANIVANSLEDGSVMESIARKLLLAEESFHVRYRIPMAGATAKAKAAAGPAARVKNTGAAILRERRFTAAVANAAAAASNYPPTFTGVAASGSQLVVGAGASVEAVRHALLKEIVRISKSRSQAATETAAVNAVVLEDISGASQNRKADFKGFVATKSSGKSASGKASTNATTKVLRQSFRKSISVMGTSKRFSVKKDKDSDEETQVASQKSKKKVLTAGGALVDEDSDEDLDPTPHLEAFGRPRMTFQESFNTTGTYQRRGNLSFHVLKNAQDQLAELRQLYSQKESFANDLRELSGEPDSEQKFDRDSEEIDNANDLAHHVLVFGSMDNIDIFINELRRPLVVAEAYHSIVIVHESEPKQWVDISDLHSDVFLLIADITTPDGFNRANIKRAFSLCMLGSKDTVTQVEGENLDAAALFAYLKLEKHLPKQLFFTVELTVASNMAVLNTTIMSRARGTENYGLVRLKSSNSIDTKTSPRRRASIASNASDQSAQVNERMQVHGAFSTHLKRTEDGDIQMRNSIPSSVMNVLQSSLVKRRRTSIGGGNSKRQEQKQHTSSTLPKPKRKLKLKRFWKSSQLKPKSIVEVNPSKSSRNNELQGRIRRALPGMFGSGIKKRPAGNDIFWSVIDSHHALPVYASGRAFVPTSFDSILCQSLFSSFTTSLVERMVCGQKYQTMYQINVPVPFIGRCFVDLFRAFLSRNLLVMALYRAPFLPDGSCLPFVATSPKPDLILRDKDRVFVYGSPIEMLSSLQASIERPFVMLPDGSLAMIDPTELEKEASKATAISTVKPKGKTLKSVTEKVITGLNLKKLVASGKLAASANKVVPNG